MNVRNINEFMVPGMHTEAPSDSVSVSAGQGEQSLSPILSL